MADKMRRNRVKWGFIWVAMASVIWGLSYVPKEAIWLIDPVDGYYGDGASLFESTIVISAIQALFFTVILFFLWSCINNKPREVYRTFIHWPVGRWFFVSAIFGGLMAMFGSTLATAYVGADYAAAIALMSALTGAIVGKVMFNEKITGLTMIGLVVLTFGGIVVLDPVNLIHSISSEDDPGAWIGYLGGLLSAVGWGVESCYNIRALEVSDNEASTPVRYAWECIIWFLILMPITGFIVGFDNFYSILIDCLKSPAVIVLMIFTALSLGIADSLLHKGYTLMGAGRGLAINSIYVPVSLFALWVFLRDYDISIWLVVGSIISVVGTVIMYWEKDEVSDSVREVKA